jgi:hypothetical protein
MATANLGVKNYEIKGGKISTGTASPATLAEVAKHKEFVHDLVQLPAVNNNLAAKQLRSILVAYNPTLRRIFDSLGLHY